MLRAFNEILLFLLVSFALGSVGLLTTSRLSLLVFSNIDPFLLGYLSVLRIRSRSLCLGWWLHSLRHTLRLGYFISWTSHIPPFSSFLFFSRLLAIGLLNGRESLSCLFPRSYVLLRRFLRLCHHMRMLLLLGRRFFSLLWSNCLETNLILVFIRSTISRLQSVGIAQSVKGVIC